jgi:hypothetical protein
VCEGTVLVMLEAVDHADGPVDLLALVVHVLCEHDGAADGAAAQPLPLAVDLLEEGVLWVHHRVRAVVHTAGVSTTAPWYCMCSIASPRPRCGWR